MNKSKLSILLSVVMMSMLLSACVSSDKKMEADVKKPVNCATAQADIKTLQAEKASTMQKIGAGFETVIPISLVVGVASGTEGTNAKIAAGDYNKMIDQKITDIQTQCGVK